MKNLVGGLQVNDNGKVAMGCPVRISTEPYEERY